MTLAGFGTLIPGVGALAERCAALVRERGGTAWLSPVLEFRAPDAGEQARLADALQQLRAGGYDWLVATSPRAVAALADAAGASPDGTALAVAPGTRVAAVGAATASALAELGVTADFVPSDESAAGLVAEWPDTNSDTTPGRVLLPASNIAHPTIADGLRARGYEVDRIDAYVTANVPLTRESADALAAGRIHAVLVTSGSVGRGIADELRAHPAVRIVSIGPQTTADLRAIGLEPAAESQQRTAESLIDALTNTLELS